ncbi:LytR/AlgR family response regulator transcription factor [Desulfobacter curvatus]|uniref:LytR/AlgR family response regulator transcription factor n=1 Tax=Desulfobacter curvatus TaxID=2290 RepID=UPI00035C9379|nr:LytTR family DNA-binding domain-containing protein [Desulfobacter curvatus]
MVLNALIIEDEPFVRQDLSALLERHGRVRIAGETGTLYEAKELLQQKFFDLVFLDVGLPGGSGFDLIPFIDPQSKIVFVTGHDHHALKAFELNALDYLLKPVAKDRLAKTLARILPEAENPAGQAEKKRVLIKCDSGSRYVAPDDILAINSIGGNYVELYLHQGEKLILRSTLKFWEAALSAEFFCRTHKSTIINLARVTGVTGQTNGIPEVFLGQHPHPFRVSRRMASHLKTALINIKALT